MRGFSFWESREEGRGLERGGGVTRTGSILRLDGTYIVEAGVISAYHHQKGTFAAY